MKLILKDFQTENDETYYHITIEMKSLEWKIRKRFSQFYLLYNELNRLYPDLSIPKLEKQISIHRILFNQEKRNEQINTFLRFIADSYTLNMCLPVHRFIYSDIFVENVDDFLAITKHKQKEYVKQFLSETKVDNYKNYITSLENQNMEIIEHKKNILAQLASLAGRFQTVDDENSKNRLLISSLSAENTELRKIYEGNKDTIRELLETIAMTNGEIESSHNQIKDLELSNKEFRAKMERLDEEKRALCSKISELTKINQQLEREKDFKSITSAFYAPSAPPMPETIYGSYKDSFSKPPSLK